MKTKSFLLRFDYSEQTRWKLDDAELASVLAREARLMLEFNSEGPIPSVTVLANGKEFLAREMLLEACKIFCAWTEQPGQVVPDEVLEKLKKEGG